MCDKEYMRRAIELAKLGKGWTNPNPLVGAVIVKNGKVIGEGYHHRYGDLHAERDAIKNLSESAEGATIYVTLEPCCHQGKQPPCTMAIVENKIAKVVIGSRDPNPLVSGKGTTFLRERGVEVVEDFLREECDELNSIFFHYITTGMPYVTLKYAMTMDGKIATKTGASKWITGDRAREYVHMQRSCHSVIMAGIGTVLEDDPMLNVRDVENGHQPTRVIIDSNLRIPLESNIVKSANEYPTIVACNKINEKAESLEKAGIRVVECGDEHGKVDLKALAALLGSEKYDSIFVEGGGIIHEAALRAGIVRHVSAYIAPKIFGGEAAKSPVEGNGVELPSKAYMFKLKDVIHLGEDILLEYDVDNE